MKVVVSAIIASMFAGLRSECKRQETADHQLDCWCQLTWKYIF